MRHFSARTLSAVLISVSIFPVSLFGRNQNSKTPTQSTRKAASEKGLLKADEGPARRVDVPIRKERNAPGGADSSGKNGAPVPVPTFRVLSHPREGRLQRGHSF